MYIADFWKRQNLVERIIFVSLFALIFLLPFDQGGDGAMLQFILQLVLLACGVLWVVQSLQRGWITLRCARFDLVIAGGIVLVVAAALTASYSYAALLEMLKIVSYLAVLYLIRLFFPLQGGRMLLLLAIIGSSVLQLIIALYNFLIWGEDTLQAGFLNPNNLACFWVIGFAVSMSIVLFSTSTSASDMPHKQGMRYGALLLAVGLAGAILMIRSRGALVSLSAVGLFLTTLRKKRLGAIFLVAMCALVIIPTPWGSLLQRLQKRDDPFAYERLRIWKSDLQLIADHPLSGVGPGMFIYHARAYNFPLEHRIARYEKIISTAHNDLLQISAEYGLFGSLITLIGLIWLAKISTVLLRQHPPDWQVVAASAGILALLVQGLFSTLLASTALAMMLTLFVGLLLDKAEVFQERRVVFAPVSGWSSIRTWGCYAVVAVVTTYLLLPTIGYPFLAYWHFMQYRQQRQQRDIEAAVRHLTRAIGYVPIQAYYHHELGQLYALAFRNHPNLDAFYESYKELTTAVRHHPDEFEFYVTLAELHRAMYYQKLRTSPTARNALRDYERAVERNPTNPFLLMSMATLYADLEEFDHAVSLMKEAVQLEPYFVGGYQLLGRLLEHLQQPEEAQAAFQQAENIWRQYGADIENQSDYVAALLRPFQ